MQIKRPTHQRFDLAKEAIVNAAVKLKEKLGYDATFEFLVDADVPPDVITRVLNGGPIRQRRAVQRGTHG